MQEDRSGGLGIGGVHRFWLCPSLSFFSITIAQGRSDLVLLPLDAQATKVCLSTLKRTAGRSNRLSADCLSSV